MEINFDNISCTHTFHVVSNNLTIPCNGILGLDFYQKYDCDLEKLGTKPRIVIRINRYVVKIPLIIAQPENNITLPAHGKKFRE